MPTNSLTDSKCKSAKTADKPIKLSDGGGLYLWISNTGAKSWRLAYRYDGKQKTAVIGTYPEIPLSEARFKREELKALIRSGTDPMAEKKKERESIKNAVPTFEQATITYWNNRNDVSDDYRATVIRSTTMHLFPKIGQSKIDQITRDDLLHCLRILDAKGRHVHVRKIRMWASQVFEWAVENGYAQNNPASQIRAEKAFGKSPVTNMAALELTDIPDFMQRLACETQTLQSVLACKFLAYTWVRTIEMRTMKWTEIDGDVWRIPGEKMKRRKDHIVPLSRQALEILDQMKARERGSDFVFCAEHRLDRPISENSVLYLLHRIGYKGKMTGHGWRSVGSTWANEHQYDKDAIERQLAHSPEDKTRAAYNRAEYLPERRKMLQDWADWLDEQ